MNAINGFNQIKKRLNKEWLEKDYKNDIDSYTRLRQLYMKSSRPLSENTKNIFRRYINTLQERYKDHPQALRHFKNFLE